MGRCAGLIEAGQGHAVVAISRDGSQASFLREILIPAMAGAVVIVRVAPLQI